MDCSEGQSLRGKDGPAICYGIRGGWVGLVLLSVHDASLRMPDPVSREHASTRIT